MMTVRDLTRTPAMRAASGAFVVATLVFLWVVVDVVRADAGPAGAAPPVVKIDVAKRVPIRPAANVQAAVEHDLFSPDREAPDTPYRMPGEASEDKTKPEPQKPSVLGTAVASDGRNFATLQLGNDPPKLVHVGDKIGEWIVRSITRGKVVLETNEGARAELAAPKPGL